MRAPAHQLLLQAAARLNADGHHDLGADVLQLARQWTPEAERLLIGGPNVLARPKDMEPLHDA
jgi:hypothetical protein